MSDYRVVPVWTGDFGSRNCEEKFAQHHSAKNNITASLLDKMVHFSKSEARREQGCRSTSFHLSEQTIAASTTRNRPSLHNGWVYPVRLRLGEFRVARASSWFAAGKSLFMKAISARSPATLGMWPAPWVAPRSAVRPLG